jgi:hypothetical protein
MGSYIRLGVGKLELDLGKNYGFRDYSALFQQSDKKDIPYFYADDIIEYKPGYSRVLSSVKRRLELIGYSLNRLSEIHTCEIAAVPNYYDPVTIDFATMLELFSNINISDYEIKLEGRDYSLGEYAAEVILNNPSFSALKIHFNNMSDSDAGTFFENLDPLYILRLLMENPANLTMNLEWRTQDIIDGGYYTEEEVFPELSDSETFLIVTEGSSDLFVIKRTLELMFPDIMDFFSFVDMHENYPFTGTGNLYKFCQGLTSIRIQNKILVIFDNDVEGNLSYQKTINLKLPKNMKIMKLPNLEEFTNFKTIGPSGETYGDINGTAVAIECFLDFNGLKPRVRWTDHRKEPGVYQGSLENKDAYIRKFKKARADSGNYDFSKLKILVEKIFKMCI